MTVLRFNNSKRTGLKIAEKNKDYYFWRVDIQMYFGKSFFKYTFSAGFFVPSFQS